MRFNWQEQTREAVLDLMARERTGDLEAPDEDPYRPLDLLFENELDTIIHDIAFERGMDWVEVATFADKILAEG